LYFEVTGDILDENDDFAIERNIVQANTDAQTRKEDEKDFSTKPGEEYLINN
jgi:hypothetical protein